VTDGPGRDAGLSGASPARFQNWLGFLFATIAVNLLFVYGMLGKSGDATLGLWYKALIWIPFNSIASMLYYVFRIKLAAATGGVFLGTLCLVMLALNWIVMFFV
jgi:phosphoglycerol transferase MdoB-like AlkP superfamily enzyme